MIHEVNADLLDYKYGNPNTPVWKVLPTNYSVDSKGLAVMGAGLAKQFVDKYGLVVAYHLGALIQCNPTIPRILPLGLHDRAFWWALPTKHEPQSNASVDLIKGGLWELSLYHQRQCRPPVLVIPRLGCGCGKMNWRHAKPIINTELQSTKEVVICHLSKYAEVRV